MISSTASSIVANQKPRMIETTRPMVAAFATRSSDSGSRAEVISSCTGLPFLTFFSSAIGASYSAFRCRTANLTLPYPEKPHDAMVLYITS